MTKIKGVSRQELVKKLSSMANDMAKEHWGINTDIEVRINGRLTRASARMVVERFSRYSYIEMSTNLLKYGTAKVIKGVLLHEVAHYALFYLGRPNSDGHPFFESELRRVGAPSTKTQKIGRYHYHRCGCGVGRHIEFGKLRAYICGRCEESIDYAFTRYYNGEGGYYDGVE